MRSMILARTYVFFMIMVFPSVLTHANSLDNHTPSTSITKYEQLKALSHLGLREEAISQALTYLETYPHDSDVRFLLGVLYYQEKSLLKARHELEMVIQQTPSYSDATLFLSHIEMAEGNYQDARKRIDLQLLLDPLNPELNAKKAQIKATLAQDSSASAIGQENQKTPFEPKKTVRVNPPKPKSYASARKHPFKKINKEVAPPEKKYKNEIGVYQQNYYISDVHSVWDYSTVYYGRATPLGKVFGKVNYANRLSNKAIQGEIEAYPVINKYLYLDIDYAFADDPHLFPDRSYAVEAYVSTLKTLDFSVGGKYNKIDKLHQFSMITFSITKFMDNYKNSATFRPYFFKPGKGSRSTLFVLNLRHMITDPYFYLGCVIGAGSSPDLADLTTINFIVLKNKIVNPYINFPLLNDRLLINLGFLFQNQLFPSGRTRNWSGGTMNVSWKF